MDNQVSYLPETYYVSGFYAGLVSAARALVNVSAHYVSVETLLTLLLNGGSVSDPAVQTAYATLLSLSNQANELGVPMLRFLKDVLGESLVIENLISNN